MLSIWWKGLNPLQHNLDNNIQIHPPLHILVRLIMVLIKLVRSPVVGHISISQQALYSTITREKGWFKTELSARRAEQS